ncbi:hypothetical protein EI94DRAFT_1771016 [Lactarius quietus]|nr:hypothetical protein EI94DRAFT_1771016 [Lactarius quietus]
MTNLQMESYDVHFRQLIPCIRTLFGDPSFAKRLNLVPECHYLDADHTTQIFKSRRPGATVIPMIISSDKMQLTLFGAKSTYPVYLSIVNIPKDICCKPNECAQMLLGYIPTMKLEHIDNKAVWCHALTNLFHACMPKLLAPMEVYDEMGVAMVTGDGVWYCCHPILATFIGNYPEQLLVACTYQGRCLKCITAATTFALSDSDPTAFHAACQSTSLKLTYHPFWHRLPFTNVFLSIIPDILHQIHQGVTKHLIHWLKKLGSEEINARCQCLPPNHNARHFHKGIMMLSRPTGREHKDVCRILLGVVVVLPLPGNWSLARLNQAVWALLDFIYLSQYPVHTSETLNKLDMALRQFHEYKEVFIELGAQNIEHFNILKLHNNYNTEQMEQLHIDYSKKGFHASNGKDEPEQTTTYTAFIEWCEVLSPFLTTQPSEKGVTFKVLSNRYGAVEFQDTLADFIVQHNFPELSASAAWRHADNTLIPFRRVSIFHKIKFTTHDPDRGNVPGRFDTAFVKSGTKFHVAQVRAVSSPAPLTDLVYVEWFSPLSTPPDDSHGMYRISRSHCNGHRLASVIPLTEICWSNWESPTVLEECRSFFVNPFLDRHMYFNLDLIKNNL